MISLLICGEGKHEFGTEAWNSKTKSYTVTEGWAQVLIRKCMGEEISFIVKRRRQLILLPRDERRYRPLPHGHGHKSLLAKLIAATESADGVVYIVDADSVSRKEWLALGNSIQTGFDQVKNQIRTVICVPISASESWMLADEGAWKSQGLLDTSALPEKPEQIWGERDDPGGDHPHRLFARICGYAKRQDSADTRRAVACSSDIEVLTAKCPISFDHFRQQLILLSRSFS